MVGRPFFPPNTFISTRVQVITIAHRLKTIIDYDRILVLGEGGRIVEFDTPGNLVNKPDSVFGAMCKKSSDWPELKKSLHIEGRGV